MALLSELVGSRDSVNFCKQVVDEGGAMVHGATFDIGVAKREKKNASFYCCSCSAPTADRHDSRTNSPRVPLSVSVPTPVSTTSFLGDNGSSG